MDNYGVIRFHSARSADTLPSPHPCHSLEPGETWTGTASIVAHSQYWELLPWEAAAGANLASVVPPPRADILQDPDYYWNMMA